MTNHYPNEQDTLANLRRKYEALEAERETLMRSHDRLEKVCIAQDDKLQALRAERDKMREALKLISVQDQGCGGTVSPQWIARSCLNIARVALETEK